MCYEKNYQDQRLPKKMKDNKWNYMFKVKRPPQDIIKTGTESGKMMGDWAKYLAMYKFNDVFLDIKLEELLNIFGRRQCKSCVEFDTGVRHETDDRQVRSWPLSPREEAIVGQEGDLVEFQLADNVYAETAAEPTAMFDSMARDFSEFGA